MLLHRLERVVDEIRLIARVGDFEIGGQHLGQIRDPLLHRLDHRKRVRAFLLPNLKKHGRQTVQAGQGPRFLIAIHHAADIADADRLAAHVGGDDVFKVLGALHASQCSQR